MHITELGSHKGQDPFMVAKVDGATEPKDVQPPLCRLPGCWQPVYEEPTVRLRDYCGRSHASQDGAFEDDVDQPALRFEVQKLKGNDTLIQNPELEAYRKRLFANTPVGQARITPPGYQSGRGGQLTQAPTRRQPTYRTSPQQFQHEQDKVRGNELWPKVVAAHANS